jgi:hypothetical protein
MRTGIASTLLTGFLLSPTAVFAADAPPRPPQPASQPAAAPAAPAARDLPPAVWNALRYFGHHQHETGGWGHVSTRVPQSRSRSTPDLNDAFTKYATHPPTLADTASIAAAFFEAGQSPEAGESAKPLARAMDALHQMAVELAPDDARRSPVVRYVLNPSVESAIALDAILACRAAAKDPVRRAQYDADARTLIARLVGTQSPDGGWPVDPKVTETLAGVAAMKQSLQQLIDAAPNPGAGRTFSATGRYADLNAAAAQAQDMLAFYERFPTPKNYLGDAVIYRTLCAAARAGFTVNPETLLNARDRLLSFQDPVTGAVGNPDPGDPDAFHQTAAVLGVLHQLHLDAAPDQKPATAAALERAHAAFFTRLRDANTRPVKDQPAKLGNAVVVFNPLDKNANAKEVRINVPPTSSVDVIAYFLLIESLGSSTHPDARKVSAGITDVLARRGARGTWGDASTSAASRLSGYQPGLRTPTPDARVVKADPLGSTNQPAIGSPAFVSGWAIRTLLLPLPPEPAK